MTQEKQESNGEDFTVAGYTFTTKEAADNARNEMNAIRYVSSKTDSKDPKQIYVLYNTMLDKELFKTPVGLDYLKDLQQYLYNNKEIPNDKIRPIPINSELQSMLADKREMTKTRGKLIELTKERDKYKDKYIKMIIVDVALICVVIAMAVIMYTSQLPTVINYENKLQDKYAGWAEELESREAQVKQAEQQYNIKVK
jgi:hypothetical protein